MQLALDMQERFARAVRSRGPAARAEIQAGLPEHLAWLPACPVPICLPATAKPRIARAAEALYEALVARTRQELASAEPARWVACTPRQRALFTRTDVSPTLVRFDFSWTPADAEPQFIECNMGDPSGAGFNDAVIQALHGFAPFRAEGLIERVEWDWLIPHHHRAVTSRYRRRFGVDPASVVFLVAEDSFVVSDQLEIALRYEGAGTPASLADPRAAGFDPRRAYVRDTIDEYVLDGFWDETRALREQLIAQGNVENCFEAALGDAKALFESLSSDSEVGRFVPLTVQLDPERARESRFLEREAWVLKPNDGYGGLGVVVGRSVSAAAWREQLEQAGRGGYVAQRWVAPPVVAVPGGDGGGEAMNVVLSAWVIGGVFVGCYARMSPSAVINVTGGGAMAAVAWV